MNRIFLILVSMFFTMNLKADFKNLAPAGMKIGNKILYGYIDQTGEFVIPPQFNRADNFIEGYARYEISKENKSKWGFISEKGDIFPPLYDDLMPFADGLAAADMHGITKYINKKMKVVITPEKQGQCIYGFFFEGLARFTCYNTEWGFINKTGRIAIKPKYKEADYDFQNGLTAVSLDGKSYFFIDKKGHNVFNKMFEDVYPFNNKGLAGVKINGKYGLINRSGIFVIEPTYDDIRYDDAGRMYSFELQNKRTCMNMETKQQFEDIYKTFCYFESGLSTGDIQIENKENKTYSTECKYINEAGEIAIKGPYENAKLFLYFNKQLAPVKLGGKWGFIDRTGNMIIQPKFDDIPDTETTMHSKLD